MLSHALKEWSIAVDALTQGQTILLLRKGGIREVGKHFEVPHRQVWLYPTYEHQKPGLLKPPWAKQITTVKPGWHPTQITLQAWADIFHVWTISTPSAVEALLPFHIWNDQFVAERFRWKPHQPLHLLLLRVYRLSTAIQINWQATYGGCNSWLTLHNVLDETRATPVLDEQNWAISVDQIKAQITRFGSLEGSKNNEII